MNIQPISQNEDNTFVKLYGDPFLTIQGEGPYAGMPAVFVRFAGCNLQCPLCDTIYTGPEERHWTIERVSQEVDRLKAGLVVITGGEPMRQSIIERLVDHLLADGLIVQIETNGTVYRALPFHMNKLTVVCSPKAALINKSFADTGADRFLVYKYVMAYNAVDIHDGLPTTVLGKALKPARPDQMTLINHPERIYLQPEDVKDSKINEQNRNAVVNSCMKYGYRCCLQMHKILGLA